MRFDAGRMRGEGASATQPRGWRLMESISRTPIEPESSAQLVIIRLQDGCYPHTEASTCNSVDRIGNLNPTVGPQVTQARVMNRVTRPSLITN